MNTNIIHDFFCSVCICVDLWLVDVRQFIREEQGLGEKFPGQHGFAIDEFALILDGAAAIGVLAGAS